MRLEVICSGDELLNGTISDTNSAMFARMLQEVGVEIARTTIVSDVEDEIVDAIKEAAARADVVLTSGGLGPTEDDRTVSALARAAGVGLQEDPEALRRLTERLRTLGREVSANNRRQCLVPDGARVLQTEVGTAPGLAFRIGGATFYVMPGVPSEARWFCERYVIPELRGQVGALFSSVTLRCAGIGESDLDNRVRGMEQQFPGISLHFRTSFPENNLKIVSRGMDENQVQSTLQQARDEAYRRVKEFVISDDGRTLSAVIRDELKRRGETLSVAESCTGGLVAKLLTDESGISAVFWGGVVAYDNRVKMGLLGVQASTLERVGAVSAETAEEMAQGVRARIGTDWGLSITGIAGPDGGTPQKPVGTVFIGLSSKEKTAHRHLQLKWDRERIRMASASAVLRWLLDEIRA